MVDPQGGRGKEVGGAAPERPLWVEGSRKVEAVTKAGLAPHTSSYLCPVQPCQEDHVPPHDQGCGLLPEGRLCRGVSTAAGAPGRYPLCPLCTPGPGPGGTDQEGGWRHLVMVGEHSLVTGYTRAGPALASIHNLLAQVAMVSTEKAPGELCPPLHFPRCSWNLPCADAMQLCNRLLLHPQ